ncbi:MAG: RidA family protein [Streptosporangiales bacterium]|nr:RidA family protein [Streptosporangiales bacterium]
MDTQLRHRPARAILLAATALAGVVLLGSGLLTGSQPVGATHKHRVIETSEAPEAIGPYSQGIGAGPTLYLSGQLPMDPETGEVLADAPIEEQTERVLKNLDAVLRADGMTTRNVVSTTVYLADLDDFERFNAAYAEFFPHDPPARATVQVARLPRDADIEISAIAVR